MTQADPYEVDLGEDFPGEAGENIRSRSAAARKGTGPKALTMAFTSPTVRSRRLMDSGSPRSTPVHRFLEEATG